MGNRLKLRFKYDLDAPERTGEHREVILKKRFLRKLYEDWYKGFQGEIDHLPEGKLLELGSGGGFIKNVIPKVITSDIIPLSWTDLTFSALDMPFKNQELSGIFMIDTFHHIPDSQKFLAEASRVLRLGGLMMMVEPANSMWGRFIYRNFHHEPFEPGGKWTIPTAGPLKGANGALPWIVFERDKQRMQQEFPDLQVELVRYHTPFRYLVSGGVSYQQLAPSFTYGFFSAIDNILSGLSRNFSMFCTLKIRKVKA